jgi:hypothetical protein
MLINTDLSSDTSLASRLNQRAEAGANPSQSSAGSAAPPASNQLDPSLQRLTGLPVGAQDADWEIQDEQDAGQAVQAARQGMFQQPGAALTAQANQLYQNVLNLLQPAD